MLSEFKTLVEQYKDTYWLIKDNTEAIPADQRTAMHEKLKELFLRDCAKLEGEDALAAERERAGHENELKEIEEIKKLKNAEIDAAYKLKHSKLNQETEIKSAEIAQQTELQKAKLEAETEIQKGVIQDDVDLQAAIEKEISEAKRDRLIPVRKHHKNHWWSLRWQPNEAFNLADQKLKLETQRSLTERKNEVIKLQAEITGSDELELAVCTIFNEYISAQRGRKAKAAARTLTELVQPLCEILASREHALEQVISKLSAPENEEDNNESQEQPEESKEQQANIQAQQTALNLEEMQQEQPSKPKPKRVRKRPETTETEKTDEEGEKN